MNAEGVRVSGRPNYRLQLTALAASAAGLYEWAANDRAAAEAER